MTHQIEQQTPAAGALIAVARRRPLRIVGWATLLTLVFGVFASCNDGDRPVAGGGEGDIVLPVQHPVAAAPPCTEGEQQSCTGTLGEHNGILSCYHGTETCEDGVWGNCVGTTTSEQEAPSETVTPSLRPLAYGAAANCVNNPCDPLCKGFVENPVGVLEAQEVGDAFSWDTGSTGNLSAATLSLGLSEPCTSGDDCQLNHHCEDVMTASACTHSKCVAGTKLKPTCDDCVGLVCKTNPSCCQRGWDCAHDVCETGTKLASTCDNANPAGSCVDDVCVQDPTCCSSDWGARCVAYAQSLCGANCGSCGPGETLNASKCYYHNNNIVSQSAARTACQARGTGWDLVTINSSTENTFVDTTIGANDAWIGYKKTSGTWGWLNGTSSYVRWDTGEPSAGDDCVRMRNSDGDWDARSCSSGTVYRSLCEGPAPALTTPSWTASCAGAVKTACDATCDTASPPSEVGECVPWRPGQTDASCLLKPDLALGVPCGAGVVPVCNHGTKAAPAGVTLSYYTAASGQFGKCTPTPASKKGTCPATTVPIPPGECISVTCPTTGATPLLTGERLVVNPAGAVSECSCLDNWSIYTSGVSCGAPTCAGTSSESIFKPVRMLIMVDRSYSMACGYPAAPCPAGYAIQRWTATKAALTAFFRDANSAGIGVAMDFFPLADTGAGDGGCGSTGAGGYPAALGTFTTSTACTTLAPGCQTPLVNLGYLTAPSSPTDTHESALVAALGTSRVDPPTYANSYSTPSHPALDGALKWAKAKQLASPNETFVVVFVTDGEPTACLKSPDTFLNAPVTKAALVTLAAQAYQTAPSVRTYTLGMDGSDLTNLDQIAAAGGTTQSFVVSGSNSAAITAAFTAALQDIALESASCTLPFNDTDELNPDNATVRYSSGATNTILVKRTGPSNCGSGGWYYDNPVTPTEVLLCPSTCSTVQADSAASVRLEVPCAPVLEPATFNQIYQASCGDAQSPLWQFLTYDTINADGGEVAFKVRSATTQAGLATATWLDARVATFAEPDCEPGSPHPGCPVDLVDLLGDRSSDEYLELAMTVTPSSGGDTPGVDDWQITYTCPFDE